MVVHQETSDPGRVGRALSHMGFDLDIRCPACDHPLPADLEGFAGFVVFGGPMSANDDHLPFVRAEIDWIGSVLDAGHPFLGLCLGAQMMARALGARVGPRADGMHEIGYVRIRPTEAGRELFQHERYFYQWHGEGFDLPGGAALLATSDRFANQAMRYGDRAYGLQFHPEVTEAMMERWTRIAVHRLTMPGAQSQAEQRRLRPLAEPAIDAWLPGFLGAWLGAAGDAEEAAAE